MALKLLWMRFGAVLIFGLFCNAGGRQHSTYAAKLRDRSPSKFRFFATLPNILDAEVALAEINYAFDTLHADGVALFTRYGAGQHYLGHEAIEPIWAELNRRHAVVSILPHHPDDARDCTQVTLIDHSHEITRAAVSMLRSGTRSNYPNCTVILSHVGGTIPFLISRFINLDRSALGTITKAQAWNAFRSFHFDIACATEPHVLSMVLELIADDHILYGVSTPESGVDFDCWELMPSRAVSLSGGRCHFRCSWKLGKSLR